ncbi:universal stress protein [Polaribacter sargassicola]|uniref:universal stress protein n=1 Tax=Polaribacter sargassicola TaxID=2836891 RepID=UPI001F26FF8D|nr:universal stress protein [Polaribacter sp. DS7-9]MCG1034818.1 universal stress protein [Polaribacter sp. DS7-9]
MKKILVPIDFSKTSEYASIIASKIAKKTDATVYLIHLIELPKGVIDMGVSSKFSIPESMLYLRKVKEKILIFKKEFFSENTNVNYFIKLNSPFEGIQKYADKINADLIIMGSKGHSELDEIIIGSNTEKIVRNSTKPVIIVKKDPESFKLKKIVFASNFEEDNKEIFSKFVNFANIFSSKVYLLKINTPANFQGNAKAKQEIKDFISDYNLPKSKIKIYNDVSVEKGILNFSEEIEADLIALATHGRSGLAHFFTGSVTKKLSKNSLRPMMTIKI